MRRSAVVTTVVVGSLVLALHATQAPPDARPTLDAVMHSVADYLTGYGRDLSAVVAEEDYAQEISGSASRSRHLRSDLLVMTDDPAHWVAFRDVFDVDGQPVRDRDDRIVKLMIANPGAGAREQAARIAAESARLNLDLPGVSVNRTLNVPIVALLFLRAEAQARSTFKLDRVDTVDGRRAAVVEFEEHALPRLIASKDNVAMRGQAWIEIESGRVLRTEVTYSTSARYVAPSVGTRYVTTTATIAVAFADEPKLGLYLPASMDEQYDATMTSLGDSSVPLGRTTGLAAATRVSHLATLTGHASYSRFRRFDVTVGTEVN